MKILFKNLEKAALIFSLSATSTFAMPPKLMNEAMDEDQAPVAAAAGGESAPIVLDQFSADALVMLEKKDFTPLNYNPLTDLPKGVFGALNSFKDLKLPAQKTEKI